MDKDRESKIKRSNSLGKLARSQQSNLPNIIEYVDMNFMKLFPILAIYVRFQVENMWIFVTIVRPFYLHSNDDVASLLIQ